MENITNTTIVIQSRNQQKEAKPTNINKNKYLEIERGRNRLDTHDLKSISPARIERGRKNG